MNKREDDRFTREQYLDVFELPKDKIILEMTDEYIKDKASDFYMGNQIHRMVGYAIEHKFLESLGNNYSPGILYQTDYNYHKGGKNIPFELKTTSLKSNAESFSITYTEYYKHHGRLNPYNIFAITEKMGNNKYSFYIENIILFSDIYQMYIDSKFNKNSKGEYTLPWNKRTMYIYLKEIRNFK